MHALACAYVVAAATVMEHRVASQFVQLRQRGYRALSFSGDGAASRTLGGDVYYPVHDGSRFGVAASRSSADPAAFSDCEDDAPATAQLDYPRVHPSGAARWSVDNDPQDEEQGYVPSPSPCSVSASPRAQGGAAPSAAEQLAAAEQQAAEQAAALEQSYKHDRFDLSGALSAMQQVVHSLNSSGVLADSLRELSYDDELQLASPTDELARVADDSPSPILAVGSPPPPQPLSSQAGLQAVKLGGFKTEALNDLFVEGPRDELRVNGRPTFWSTRGWFLYHSPQTRTWGVARASRLDRVRGGQSSGLAHSPEGYDLLGDAVLEPPEGWREWDAEAGRWTKRPGSGLQSRGRVRALARGPGAPGRPDVGTPPERRGPPSRAAEPPTAELHFGSYSPPLRATSREPDSAIREPLMGPGGGHLRARQDGD